MRVLLAGWFSFEQMGATAGDLLCRDLVRRWLAEAGVPRDVAVAHPFTDGVDWRNLDPKSYSHLIFVCGPFGNGPPVDEMLAAFSHCRMVGLNLSMLQDLERGRPLEVAVLQGSLEAMRDIADLETPTIDDIYALANLHIAALNRDSQPESR